MPNPNNYRYYDTIADMKASDMPLAGDWARCDGYAETGDGGGGWFRFDTNSTAPVDDGLVFEHDDVTTGRYIRIVNEGHYNARWWGAKGDGTGNDQPELNAAAAAAQADGIALYIPSGEYRVQPNTPTGRIIEITGQNFRVFGDGADVTSIKIGNSSSRENVDSVNYTNYIGFFVVDDYDTDASGFHLSGLTLDANYDDNVIASEEDLKQGKRRGGVEIRNGTGITVERCRFLDFPRQCLFIVSDGPARRVNDVKVLHNECRTVTASIGELVKDEAGQPVGTERVTFDMTAILIRADGVLIEGNRVIGNPTNYYISRTGIQGTGNDVRILANEIVRYYRGIIVGTGEGDDRVVIGNAVIGNTMRDMNGGVEINVQAGETSTNDETNGYAMRNCIVQGNSIHLNKNTPSNSDGFSINASDKLLHGILLRTGTDTDVVTQDTATGNYAVDGLTITDNEIYNTPSPTADDLNAGSGLIELNSNLVKLALTTPNRNWVISNNTLFSSPRRGITLFPKGIHNMTVSGNTIVNVGQRATTEANKVSHRCGIRYVGGFEDPTYSVDRDGAGAPVLVDGEAQITVSSTLPLKDKSVRISGNHIIDRRSPTLTEAGVVLIGFARSEGCEDIECLDNHVSLEDARSIPIVETETSSMTPFIRAHTGKMTFEQPDKACRYGSTIIDEVTGKTRVQATAGAGMDWKEAAPLV